MFSVLVVLLVVAARDDHDAHADDENENDAALHTEAPTFHPPLHQLPRTSSQTSPCL